MRSHSCWTSSASTCAVVILVRVVEASLAASASHLDFVRLAMHSSVKTSLTWQHLEMATLATPPQPITRTLLMMELLCISLLYDVYGCFVGVNIVARLWQRQPSRSDMESAPYILSPDKVENVGRGLDPSAGRRGRRSLQGWLLTFPVPAAIPAASCRPWPWKRRSGRAWGPARSRPRQ